MVVPLGRQLSNGTAAVSRSGQNARVEHGTRRPLPRLELFSDRAFAITAFVTVVGTFSSPRPRRTDTSLRSPSRSSEPVAGAGAPAGAVAGVAALLERL